MIDYLKTILFGGLLAGLLDITYAFSAYALIGVQPTRVLQAIASGLLGQNAYQGGTAMAVLGLSLHFLIALIMAAVFLGAFVAFEPVKKHVLLAGAGYGALLFLIMNYVVVPLSNAVPGKPPEGWLLIGGIAAHIFLVGAPIALAAKIILRVETL